MNKIDEIELEIKQLKEEQRRLMLEEEDKERALELSNVIDIVKDQEYLMVLNEESVVVHKVLSYTVDKDVVLKVSETHDYCINFGHSRDSFPPEATAAINVRLWNRKTYNSQGKERCFIAIDYKTFKKYKQLAKDRELEFQTFRKEIKNARELYY